MQGNVVDRENDTHTWLTNKLGTSNDSWTGSSICSQLNAEVLRNTKECFPMLVNQVKIKLLLSLFHIPKRNIDEWRVELEEIIDQASVDSDVWISMVAEIIKTFPSTGSLNTDFSDLDEHRFPFALQLINDIKKTMSEKNDPAMQPLECHYLNKPALAAIVGNIPSPTKYFRLKKKPKCLALRMELARKSSEAAENLKKNTAPTVPLRSRGMPRKMTDTTPLKGIPSRMPTSGFRNSGLNSSPMTNRTPLTNRIRKDGGIKLLDITEQPMGYAQAKRRKRQQELEEQQKKAEEAKNAAAAPQTTTPTTEVSTTPEYAQGLAPITAPATPAAAVTTTTSVATVLPQPYSAQITSVPVVTPTLQNPITPATTNVIIVTTPPVITPVETPAKPVQAVRPQQAISQIRPVANTNQQTTTANTRKGLSLTREQMLEAQEMFRTANKVTRPEKALILGFMAGSRDNPCPKLGNIVTVMLSENVEEVTQPDGTAVLMQVETHFQMNYTNGEWKRIKKNRRIVNEESAGAATNQAA